MKSTQFFFYLKMIWIQLFTQLPVKQRARRSIENAWNSKYQFFWHRKKKKKICRTFLNWKLDYLDSRTQFGQSKRLNRSFCCTFKCYPSCIEYLWIARARTHTAINVRPSCTNINLWNLFEPFVSNYCSEANWQCHPK